MTMAPGLGAEFAGYRVEALLGRGGVGLVYLAEDLNLPRRVALKILRAEYAEDPQFRERFVRESRLAASLDHPNIVPIYKAGEAEGVLYIAMRYVDGTDLRRLLAAGGRLDLDRALGILAQVGSALDAAHAQGLCHRDVKPANILVTRGVGGGMPEQAYLVDFGITKRTTTAGLTQAGQFVGTLDYAAPEQIRGQAIDARTDVYSLGCVLYECLAGAAPFRRDSDVDTMQAHLSAPRPRLSATRPEVGPDMDRVLSTAMARSPDDRYGSSLALVTAVRAARPRSGVDRRSATVPPRPAGPAAPPPPAAAPPAPPAAPRAPRLAPVVAGAAALVAAGALGVVLLAHHGGGTGAAPPAGPGASPAATPSPGPLLTLSDFAAGSVAPDTSTDLALSQVTCGVPATGEVEERTVAFIGRGDTTGRDYFNAVASFPSEVEARSYLDRLTDAARRCPVRLPDPPPTPRLGDGTVRLLFPSKPEARPFVFDALYIRSGRAVSLILVSRDGTTPPPPGDAVALGRRTLARLAAAGG